MTASAEILVILFDALMIDDAVVLGYLLRRFPLMRKKASELTDDERDVLSPPESMTNHFYTCHRTLDDDKDVKFGLVALDTPTARVLARECELESLWKPEDYIHWGANTDPVEVATVADIAEVLEASKKHATPAKVLSLLKKMNAAQVVKSSISTAVNPSAPKRARSE